MTMKQEWATGEPCPYTGWFIGSAECGDNCGGQVPARAIYWYNGDPMPSCTACDGPVIWKARSGKLPPVVDVPS